MTIPEKAEAYLQETVDREIEAGHQPPKRIFVPTNKYSAIFGGDAPYMALNLFYHAYGTTEVVPGYRRSRNVPGQIIVTSHEGRIYLEQITEYEATTGFFPIERKLRPLRWMEFEQWCVDRKIRILKNCKEEHTRTVVLNSDRKRIEFKMRWM